MISESLSSEFIYRLLINSLVLTLLLRVVYYRHAASRDAMFGFYLFGHGVYIISALMHDVEISMGFAFGLFAVLSMLRYRTESISLRDMTYLFIVIVMSLMSAVGPITMLELMLLNAFLCLIVAGAESKVFAPRSFSRVVVYDRIDNLKEEQREELLRDLRARIDASISDVEVGNIDLLRDSAQLRVTSLA